jgi:DNA-directed RNA polymerase subunit H (RpoH/RPB5)
MHTKNIKMSVQETLDAIARLRRLDKVRDDLYMNESRFLKIVRATQDNVGKGDTATYLQEFDDSIVMVDAAIQYFEGILIVPNKITSGAVGTLQGGKMKIQVFSEVELLFNVLTHDLCPKYTQLSPSEAAIVFRTIATPEKLPRLRDSDMVTRYFNAPKGSVMKVEFLQAAGWVVEYRIVA